MLRQVLSISSSGSCGLFKVGHRSKSLDLISSTKLTHQVYLYACSGKYVLCCVPWTRKMGRCASWGLFWRLKEALMRTLLSGSMLCVGGKPDGCYRAGRIYMNWELWLENLLQRNWALKPISLLSWLNCQEQSLQDCLLLSSFFKNLLRELNLYIKNPL